MIDIPVLFVMQSGNNAASLSIAEQVITVTFI